MKNVILTFAFLMTALITLSGQHGTCPPPSCECVDGLSELQLYYFGPDGANVNIEVYSDQVGGNQIALFAGVVKGDLLTLSAAGLPTGIFPQHTFFRITDPVTRESCLIRIYTQCPRNAWPGATDDLQVLGKQYGPLFVSGYTSAGNNQDCGLEDVAQYWRVGGNVLPLEGGEFGSLNIAPIHFIIGGIRRATLDGHGNLKLGTGLAEAQLHVSRDARIDEELDIYGVATIHNAAPSASPADGALIVSGGAGIGENLNVAQRLGVGGDAAIALNTAIGEHLSVGASANIAQNAAVGQNLSVGASADIGQNATVGQGLSVGASADIGQNATIGQGLSVGASANIAQNASVGHNLNVGSSADIFQNAAVGQALSVGASATVGANLGVGSTATIGANLNVGQDAQVSGRLQVGTAATPAGFAASVDGRIICEELRVRNSNNWPDYVFAADYPLMALEELEAFIAANRHLPGIPSETDVQQNQGFDLGEMQRLQMEKIEELTLYTIALNRENAQLKEHLSEMQEKLAAILAKLEKQ
jgi:UDP-3-O-[3-hydroxymyristoyl] glucosamine N-acyltransferase